MIFQKHDLGGAFLESVERLYEEFLAVEVLGKSFGAVGSLHILVGTRQGVVLPIFPEIDDGLICEEFCPRVGLGHSCPR